MVEVDEPELIRVGYEEVAGAVRGDFCYVGDADAVSVADADHLLVEVFQNGLVALITEVEGCVAGRVQDFEYLLVA